MDPAPHAAARCADLVLLALLACLAGLGVLRGLMLYARGVRIVVVDRQRSLTHGLLDLAQLACLLLWGYEVVAYAWPLRARPGPPWLGTILVDARWADVAGIAMLILGPVIYAQALRALGASWRIGIDRERPGPLVTTAIFTWTRNPIYVSLNLVVIGAFLVLGPLVLLLLALLNLALFHQLILREERFLVATYGDAYRSYCRRVGRYVTWR